MIDTICEISNKWAGGFSDHGSPNSQDLISGVAGPQPFYNKNAKASRTALYSD